MKTTGATPGRTSGTGRNEMCPCGSGRKYKRCCSAQSPVHGLTAAECFDLGNGYLRAGQTDKAIEHFTRAATLSPGDYRAHSNLGLALEEKGLRHQAFESYWAAVRNAAGTPELRSAFTNYLICLNARQRELFGLLRSDVASGRERMERHALLAGQLRTHSLPFRRDHTNVPDPQRRLRIGYLSADFRMHSVAHFITPILASHDRSAVEVFCYYNCPLSDEVTRKISAFADNWRSCGQLSDESLSATIRSDGIDILVDLAGHTLGNRILSVALKPAPVQVGYLGYPHPTCLDALDYVLADALAGATLQESEGRGERALLIEPSMLVYQPPLGPHGLLSGAAPHVCPPPSQDAGYVTFGCFNAASKISDTAIRVWADVLLATPRSRLLLKSRGLEETGLRDRLMASFAGCGIAPERLRMEGRTEDLGEHLGRYGQVDIALDTIPYNGVTTSFEALWMGVPFITLEGNDLASRMGLTIATNSGHPEWVAHDTRQYVAKAASLASDPLRLATLRKQLRERLEASVLTDASRFTRTLERAYRRMWCAWCEGR